MGVTGPSGGLLSPLAMLTRTPCTQLIVTWSPTLNPATTGDEDALVQLVGIWAFACTVSSDVESEVTGP